VRVSFAGLTFLEAKLKAPRAEAREDAAAGERLAEPVESVLFEGRCLDCCKVLAKAFSWVRTNLARF
jgi:hypothetical protein